MFQLLGIWRNQLPQRKDGHKARETRDGQSCFLITEGTHQKVR